MSNRASCRQNGKLAAVVDIRFSGPAAGLERFVRFYVHRHVHIRGAPVIHPVPARAASMIGFEFGDPVDVISVDGLVRRKSLPVVVVSPQTHRKDDLHLHGRSISFVIMFHPDGLERLFGIPMPAMTDNAYDAQSVFGGFISRKWQILGDAGSFKERVRRRSLDITTKCRWFTISESSRAELRRRS